MDHVLVIYDHDAMREGMAVTLKKSGHEVASVQRAMRRLRLVGLSWVAMNRALASVLIGCMVGCATPHRQAIVEPFEERRIANLERAAKYPWKDEGACAVREASGEWRALVERCFYALDRSRIMFRDADHRCPVAQVDAVTVEEIVGVCLLVQPELAVAGAIIIIGAVIVGAAIAAELAPAKKPGCYCKCLYNKKGPYIHERVAHAGICIHFCDDVLGSDGYECGGETGWFRPKVSLRN